MTNSKNLALGVDLGAVSAGVALLRGRTLLKQTWAPHDGDEAATLERVLADYPLDRIDRVGVTGSRAAGHAEDLEPLDEIVCAVRGARFLLPEVRSLLLVGGERCAFVELDAGGRYLRHATNGSCACGTGLFLEQQAAFLDLSLGDFEKMARRHEGESPNVATRCSVFARTDLVHLLQSGTGREAVCSGLCRSVAQGLCELLVKGGRRPAAPAAMIGGAARLKPLRDALEEALDLRLSPLAAPELAVAVGAALQAEEGTWTPVRAKKRHGPADHRRPLPERPASRDGDERQWTFEQTRVTLYRLWEGPLALGMDVGSRSTKAMLIDSEGRAAAGFYTWTEGKPLEAAKEILRAVGDLGEREGPLEIEAAGVTGSGRKLIAHAFSADLELNEITAHAAGALHRDPGVDTILEIGGQDSKYTRLADGRVIHVTMNHACAAGTGSFIEEQARRMGVALEECAALATGVGAPVTSERCTVFMERDVGRLAAEGHSTGAILAAVLHSVCENYLNKVVGAYPLGERIVMQGATALNSALVAAFEQRLGRTVEVSRHCHLAGALGAALAARREQRGPSRFRGLTLASAPFATGQTTCELCSNQCRLTTLESSGIETGWGMRCGREYDEARPGERAHTGAIERYEKIRGARARIGGDGDPRRSRREAVRIGIPRALYCLDQADLWRSFWTSLNFEVVTRPSTARQLATGRRLAGVMTCAPAALFLGQALELMEGACDHLFLPTVIRGDAVGPSCDVRVSQQRTDAYLCFVTQYLPTLFRCRAPFDRPRMISPLLSLNKTPADVAGAIHETLVQALPFENIGFDEVLHAYSGALDIRRDHDGALEEEGRRTLDEARGEGGMVVALMGMPYATLDPTLNLDVVGILEDLGVPVVLQGMLPRRDAPGFDEIEDGGTHWQYGKQSLAAAQWAAREKSVYPIYLSCFQCGPDALLMPRFRAIMEREGKPYLIVQLDSQGSDTGLVTRIEAGIETFRDHLRSRPAALPSPEAHAAPAAAHRTPPLRRMCRRRTYLVPRIDDMICRLWDAMFTGQGYSVRFFEQSADSVREGQAYTNGGECLAIPSIVGGAIRTLRDGPGEDPAVFVPTSSYSCAYPEFSHATRLALDRAGFEGVPVYAPNLFAFFPGASVRTNQYVWECLVAADLLRQAAFETRPGEVERGMTDRILEEGLGRAEGALRERRKFMPVVEETLEELARVPVDGRPRPRVLLVGNLFLRFNPLLNQSIVETIEGLGARVVSPPMSDYTLTARLQNRRLLQQERMPWRWRVCNHLFVRSLEDVLTRYDKAARRAGAPGAREPFDRLERYVSELLGIPWSLGGETLSVLGRVLQAVATGRPDAVVHINSLFCQPAYVSDALLERILVDEGIPFLNLYYDGMGDHTSAVRPLLQLLDRDGDME